VASWLDGSRQWVTAVTARRKTKRDAYLRASRQGTLMQVSRTGALTMTLVTVLWAVTPTVACFLPMPAMSAAERECCHKMAHQCGSAVMPASHSCCQTSHQRDSVISPALTYSPARHFNMVVVPRSAFVPIHSASVSRHFLASEAPPPEPSPGCSSILRI
jgi:hypothetical protein